MFVGVSALKTPQAEDFDSEDVPVSTPQYGVGWVNKSLDIRSYNIRYICQSATPIV